MPLLDPARSILVVIDFQGNYEDYLASQGVN